MRIELEDIMYWMDAIRNSEDRYRTLEAFWKGQLRSKENLIENLERVDELNAKSNTAVIHGGWLGVTASLLFNSGIDFDYIESVDLDKSCKETANTINKRYEMSGEFCASAKDMITYEYDFVPDLVVNTSCEHLTLDSFDYWLGNIPRSSIIALQNNDYYEHEDHINCVENLGEFIEMSGIDPIFTDQIETHKYTRFTLIGVKTT